jgi:hypothetical protein
MSDMNMVKRHAWSPLLMLAVLALLIAVTWLLAQVYRGWALAALGPNVTDTPTGRVLLTVACLALGAVTIPVVGILAFSVILPLFARAGHRLGPPPRPRPTEPPSGLQSASAFGPLNVDFLKQDPATQRALERLSARRRGE